MEKATIYTAIVVTTVTVIYYNSLRCGFVFDDVSAIKDNKDLRGSTPISNLFWNDFWGTPMHMEKSHKSYRPLCVLTFRMNFAVGGLDSMGYHLVNVMLHGIVCVLFMRLCRILVDEDTGFVAALLFAVHPVHTEAVTGVVGRAELLSSIFYIVALLSYIRCTRQINKTNWPFLWVTVVMVLAAMLSKEQGITVIGVCGVYEVFIAQKLTLTEIIHVVQSVIHGKPCWMPVIRPAAVRIIALVCSTLCLLVARIKVMGAQLPVFTRFDNPASMATTPTRQLTLNYLLPINAWLLLCPSWLCCDWTMGTVPLITSFLDPRNVCTLTFYVVLGRFALFALTQTGRRVRIVVMCVSMIILPFVPASNLFFPVGFVVAERILYIPSMGFCLLVAVGFQTIIEHKRHLKVALWSCMALLQLLHATKTVTRNQDWQSEYTIFQAGLRINTNNAKLFNNVGHALENEKRFEEALKYFGQAARVQADDIGAHINVGRTHNNLKNYEAAEEAYRRAMQLLPPVRPGQSYTARVAPNHLNVFINLGNLISKNQSRLLEADALYKMAISMRSDYTQAYINRGDILLKLNRTKEARDQYETALRYEEHNPDLYYNLGVVLIEQNKAAQALQNFEKALQIDPNHKQTLFNSAVLMQETGSAHFRPEAYRRLHKVQQHEPDNEKVYFNLAMLAMDDGQFESAQQWFDKAVQLKDDFRSALFNMALMLANDLKRPLEAVPYLNKLLHYYPDHTKGLILMGDININHLKNIAAAEKNFLKILETEPHNVQANHNLCVVYVEQGQLSKAESCLLHAVSLAPQEQYIRQHLQIVRNRIHQKSKLKNNKKNASPHLDRQETSEKPDQEKET